MDGPVGRVADQVEVAVQVGIGHVRAGQGEVQRGGDAQGRLVHAADHDLHARRPGDRADLHALGDSADLHQLDVEHVGQVAAGQPEGVAERGQALVGHGGKHPLPGHLAELLEMPLLGRLFEQLQARRHGLVDEPQGLLDREALVGVEAQLDLVAHFLADLEHARGVRLGVQPAFELQGLEAPLDPLPGLLDRLVLGQDADGHAGSDRVAVPAQQFPGRQVALLAQDVHQGHVDGGLGGGLVLKRRPELLQEQGRPQRVSPADAGLDHLANGLQGLVGHLAGNLVVRGRTAAAHESPVGHDPQEDVGRRFQRVVGRRVGTAQPHRDRPCFHPLDLHGTRLPAARAFSVRKSPGSSDPTDVSLAAPPGLSRAQSGENA